MTPQSFTVRKKLAELLIRAPVASIWFETLKWRAGLLRTLWQCRDLRFLAKAFRWKKWRWAPWGQIPPHTHLPPTPPPPPPWRGWVFTASRQHWHSTVLALWDGGLEPRNWTLILMMLLVNSQVEPLPLLETTFSSAKWFYFLLFNR